MKAITVLAAFLVQSAFCGTPTEALTAFKKAAETKNFEEAWKLSTRFNGLPDQITEHLKAEVAEFIDSVGEDSDFEILEEKTEGDCAVVVINESMKDGRKSFDIDPAYLLKQDGEWRVFPDVSDWELAEQFAKDKVETYKRLEIWFKERKAELKKQHKG